LEVTAWTKTRLSQVEQALDRWVGASEDLDSCHEAPAQLLSTMRYAVLDGGKRLRPLLVMAAFESVQGGYESALPAAGVHPTNSPVDAVAVSEAPLRAACAVELIHAYSLVHDDMPCMDNDVLRRGKPTVHVKFGEAMALLAGDALQALAFELLTPSAEVLSGSQQASLCRLLSRAAGCAGMAGGQAIDLASVGSQLSEAQLREMHRLKTGALLQASVMMGAACAEASAKAQTALQRFGAAIGLAYQVVDDVLDVTADSGTLGKTAGKDALHDKPTYVSLMGLEQAKTFAQQLHEQALNALGDTGLVDTCLLQALADTVVRRAS